MIIGALEAGGTKMVCAVGTDKGEILRQVAIPTQTPDITIPEMIDFFQKAKQEDGMQALGIGCFGPIDLNRESKTYGYITNTPKQGWENCDIVGAFKSALDIPVGFDTDVNCSALGEHAYGVGKDVNNLVYITIGTGIGIGVISEGKLLHGMLHPEGGHILLTRHSSDSYAGKCPFHKNCFEGLAAGPAIEERWGKKGAELAERDEVWELEADYIAQALVNYTMILSPEKFILGGGVMHQTQILPLVRKKYREYLADYIVTKQIKDIDHYIVGQSLNDKQGILGALKLGMME